MPSITVLGLGFSPSKGTVKRDEVGSSAKEGSDCSQYSRSSLAARESKLPASTGTSTSRSDRPSRSISTFSTLGGFPSSPAPSPLPSFLSSFLSSLSAFSSLPSFLSLSSFPSSGCSSSGGWNGERSPFFRAAPKILVVAVRKGSGWRVTQGAGTRVRRSRSERNQSHLPSWLQAGLQLLKRSEVRGTVRRVAVSKRWICWKVLAAEATQASQRPSGDQARSWKSLADETAMRVFLRVFRF